MPRKSDIQVGSASVKIVADKKGLKDGIDSSKKDLADLSGAAEKEMGRFKAAFATGAIAAALAVGAAMKEIAVKTIDVSAEFERMGVKLNALTKGRGKETLDELNKWAMVMPVNTLKAVDAFTMMMAMGLNPTIDKMTTLVDVSVLFGEEAMTSIARALGQMQQLGKISYQELMQFANAGINARKYLVDAFGMSIEEIQKSGKDITEITNAILEGLKKEFGGAASEASKSWAGVKETFFSMINEIARKGGESEGSFDGLKESVRGLTKYLQENEAMFVDIAKNSVVATSSMISFARSITDFVTPAIKGVNDAFGTWIDMAKLAGLITGDLAVTNIKDVWEFEKDPEKVIAESNIKKLEEEIVDFKNQISNPTAFKIFKGEDEFLRVSALIQEKQNALIHTTQNLQKHISEKALADDFDFFTEEMKKAQNNLDDLSKFGGSMSPLEQPKTKSEKNVNQTAYADTMKDLALHYSEINNEISVQEKALMAVDAIVDRQKKDLKEIGISEKEIARIRGEAHKQVLGIVAGQEELKKIVENVKKLEEGGKIYGDDYGTLKEGIADQWSINKDLEEQREELDHDLAKSIGEDFADAFLTGFERGVDGLGDVMRGVLENQVFGMISKSITEHLQKSISNISTNKFMASFGPALGSIAGGLFGAGIGKVSDSLFGDDGNQYAAVYKAQEKLAEEIRENTKATVENTRFKRSGDMSSYSGGFFDLQTSADDARKTLKDQMEELKSPIGDLFGFDIGEYVDQESGLSDFIESLSDMTINTGGWAEALGQFKSLSDTLRATGKDIPVGLESIIATLEEFSVDLNSVQKDIIVSARDMFETAGDAFRTESEIQKREIERSGKDLLIGLAESFKLEGVKLDPVWEETFFGVQVPFERAIDDDYISALSSLTNVQEISQKLLSDLTPGTDAYNQAMETSLLIYETARLRQEELRKSMLEPLTSSVSDWKMDLERRDWGVSDWTTEFETIGRSIEGLNVLSDSYFSDAVELAEKQFDALKQIASFSEAQLAELKSSSRSLADQLWDITKGGGADTTGIEDWMGRGESLYLTAEKSLSAADISAFQSFVPDLKDAMLASGYSATYVNDQLEWALSTLLEKVNGSMASLSSSIDKLPGLAPTLQPIQISLNFDGRMLSNVIIDQLNTNANLVTAVRKAV